MRKKHVVAVVEALKLKPGFAIADVLVAIVNLEKKQEKAKPCP
jgi:hypothetical protein